MARPAVPDDADTIDPRGRRERLIVENLPLVRALASRYANRGEAFDDLVQVGTVGLIKAVDRFEPERGTPLAAFATPTILGEIRRHFRDATWAIRVPRRIGDDRARVAAVIDDLTARLGRSPTVPEVAVEAGLAEDDVLDALAAEVARRTVPLAGPGPGPEDDPAAQVGEEDPGFDLAETRADLAEGLERLPPRERAIVHLRFAQDLTQSEIGHRLGISQMHVSRLLRRALDTLAEASGDTP